LRLAIRSVFNNRNKEDECIDSIEKQLAKLYKKFNEFQQLFGHISVNLADKPLLLNEICHFASAFDRFAQVFVSVRRTNLQRIANGFHQTDSSMPAPYRVELCYNAVSQEHRNLLSIRS